MNFGIDFFIDLPSNMTPKWYPFGILKKCFFLTTFSTFAQKCPIGPADPPNHPQSISKVTHLDHFWSIWLPKGVLNSLKVSHLQHL